jgi:hypothetical protein
MLSELLYFELFLAARICVFLRITSRSQTISQNFVHCRLWQAWLSSSHLVDFTGQQTQDYIHTSQIQWLIFLCTNATRLTEQLADGHIPAWSSTKLSNISPLICTYRFWFVNHSFLHVRDAILHNCDVSATGGKVWKFFYRDLKTWQ